MFIITEYDWSMIILTLNQVFYCTLNLVTSFMNDPLTDLQHYYSFISWISIFTFFCHCNLAACQTAMMMTGLTFFLKTVSSPSSNKVWKCKQKKHDISQILTRMELSLNCFDFNLTKNCLLWRAPYCFFSANICLFQI